MAIQILVENEEVFAKLNYIRDFLVDEDLGYWDEERELYLNEAKSKQVQEHYTLTLEEINELMRALKLL